MTKKATQKKPELGKKRRKNAKSSTYEEAHWGWAGEPYIMDLALRLTDSFSQDPGTAAYQEGVDLVNSEVVDLVARDASFLSDEADLGELSKAIQLVNKHKCKTHQKWVKPSLDEVETEKIQEQWKIVHRVKREFDEGDRKQLPTIGGLLEMFEAAGCPERYPGNARKKVKAAGWKLAGTKRGRRRNRS